MKELIKWTCKYSYKFINSKVLVLLAIFGGNVSTAAESNALEKEFLNPVGTSFSNVVTVSHGGIKTIHISGQVGFAGNEVPEDFGQQVENAFANLRQELADAGANFADIIKTNTYIVNLDSEKLAAYSSIRAQHFSQENPPASTLIGVSALVFPNLLVEIEATAVKSL